MAKRTVKGKATPREDYPSLYRADKWFAGVGPEDRCDLCDGPAREHFLTVSGGYVVDCEAPNGCLQFAQGGFRQLVAPARSYGERVPQERMFAVDR